MWPSTFKGSRSVGLRLGLRFEEWETAVRKRVRKMRIAHPSRLCVNSKKSSPMVKSSHLLHKQLKTTLQLTYDLRTGSLSNGMYSRG